MSAVEPADTVEEHQPSGSVGVPPRIHQAYRNRDEGWERKIKFLEHYAQCGNITDSARVAGIKRRTYYDWVKFDDEFNEMLGDANEEVKDVIRQAFHDRGIHGVQEPMVSNGRVVAYRTVYSDPALIRLAEARMPDEFGKKQQIDVHGEVRDVEASRTEVRGMLIEEMRRMKLRGAAAAELGTSPSDGQPAIEAKAHSNVSPADDSQE